MALTLAEQFKETAGKDFPEWQAYEEMRVERDLAAKPVLKIDLNNLEDLSDAELDKNPELLAIKRARERQAAALADELDEIIKERREKEEITARRNDLLEETMDISGRMQQWDNEISDFGNLGLTNKEVMDRLSFFKKNKEEIIQNLIDQGKIKPGQGEQAGIIVEGFFARKERERQRQEYMLNHHNTLSPELQAQQQSDAAAQAQAQDSKLGQVVVGTTAILEYYGYEASTSNDIEQKIQKSEGVDNNDALSSSLAEEIVIKENAVQTDLERAEEIGLIEQQIASVYGMSTLEEKEADLKPEILTEISLSNQMAMIADITPKERTFLTNSIPTEDFAKVAANRSDEATHNPKQRQPEVGESLDNKKIVASLNF